MAPIKANTLKLLNAISVPISRWALDCGGVKNELKLYRVKNTSIYTWILLNMKKTIIITAKRFSCPNELIKIKYAITVARTSHKRRTTRTKATTYLHNTICSICWMITLAKKKRKLIFAFRCVSTMRMSEKNKKTNLICNIIMHWLVHLLVKEPFMLSMCLVTFFDYNECR